MTQETIAKAQPPSENWGFKTQVFKFLNGMSLGVVIAIIPPAILTQLSNLFHLTKLTPFLSLSSALMCLMVGLGIAIQLKLDLISAGSLAISTFIAGGAYKGIDPQTGMLQFKGSGDVLNAALGAAIGVGLIFILEKYLKSYKLLLLPPLLIAIVGLISSYTAIPISQVTHFLGLMIKEMTQLQPLFMSMLIGLSFALIIVSPVSSVAVAMLINLSDQGAAAANIGIAALSISLSILSYRTNGFGTSLAVTVGSPKLLTANFLKRPKMIVPALVSAFICPILVPFLDLQGTAMSAGFGLSGLIGPLGHLGIVGFSLDNWLIAILSFIIIPTIIPFLSIILFRDLLHFVDPEDYRISY